MTQRKGIILAGWIGHAPVPDHHGPVETAFADLRQADDLLPAERPDAVGYPRDCDHHHARRIRTSFSACWAMAGNGG